MVPGPRGYSTLIVAGLLMACGSRSHSASRKSSEQGALAAAGHGSGAVVADARLNEPSGTAAPDSTGDPSQESGPREAAASRRAVPTESAGDPPADPGRASTNGRSATDQQQSAAAAEATRLHLYVVAHLQRSVSKPEQPDALSHLVEWIGNLGFVGTRIGFEWPRIEPQRGDFQWSQIDSVVAVSRRAGLQIYGLLLYTPEWARPANTSSHERPVLDGSAQRGDAAFAHFAAEVARRYRGKVRAWEIWNEPNIKPFWSHVRDGRNLGPDPDDYLPLYRLARDSIRTSVPDVMVIPAGLASGPRSLAPAVASHRKAGGYPPAAYLNALLRDGLKPAIVTVHPYTNRPIRLNANGKPVNPLMASVEDVLKRHHLTDTRIWVTEWGVDASRAKDPAELQSWYSDGLHALVCDPRVSVVTLYDLVYTGGKDRYGLLGRDGSPTANGRALDSILQHWTSCR